ncbi:recombinase family protein [Intestinibacillus massiliensis]|uniref:recombinase family protein n=1 Tax=Intestinibacillus massiliensis TaxID=1871029 RepID=UPI000B35E808|nr:recombinase family protein [Intestinibacillus massiliensis]
MVKIYGYARVSSKEQNLDRQMIALREYVQDERDIITDKESGKNFDRPGYRSLRDALLRHGDTLVIKSLDRLGRNKEQVKAELEYFKAQGIRLKIIDLPTTMTELPEGQSWIIDMINNILIEVLSSIAEQERETIRQRQAEGIAAAKEKGKHLGRRCVGYPERWDTVYQAWVRKNITAIQAMQELGVKKSTFYKLARQYKEET